MIIDGNALLHRAWHAIPPLKTKSGEVVNAVYGFATILLKALKELKPTHAAVAFDTPAPTFRHKEFEAYKAQREKKPDELYRQIDRIKELLDALRIPSYSKEGFEADDCIASMVASVRSAHPDTEIAIVTGDKDTFQLIDEKTSVYALKRGITDTEIYNEAAIADRYGLVPAQLNAVKALSGDSSDNIPGVKGIGEKTALDLVQRYGTLEKIYDAAEHPEANGVEVISPHTRELLVAQREGAYMSYHLVQLVSDLDIGFSFGSCTLGLPDQEKVAALFQELEFKSLLGRVHDVMQGYAEQYDGASLVNSGEGDGRRFAVPSTVSYRLAQDEQEIRQCISDLRMHAPFAFDTETTSLDVFTARVVGISVSYQKASAYYIPWQAVGETGKQELAAVLEDVSIPKLGHNSKYDIAVLMNEGIHVRGVAFDTMLAAYLLNPGTRSYGLDALSFSEFGHQKIPITALIGEGKNQITMDRVPIAKISVYACEDADFTYRLYEKYRKELEESGQSRLLSDIEVPLIPVLFAMEHAGVLLDMKCIANLSKEVHAALEEQRKEIHALAGEEFNINSTQQLKMILFEKLGIEAPKLKRGKTGVSLAASELEKMKGLHPVIDHILAYRELGKLVNTYIDVLPTLISPVDGRIHTSFNQTIAATGRLSSSNPNLQNIPVKTALGRKMRSCFVAQAGCRLLAADYSQVELRIIASLAQDKAMIESFREGIDIHRATAARINGVTPEDVTSDQRRAAKEVNFGVLYGMGPGGLAKSTGLSFAQAAVFIDKYFAAYPAIREYMDQCIALARSCGYSETFFGRRRYLPDLESGMPQLRAAAERAAINMPVQGTAADIMKLAMIAVHNKISDRKDIRMILQVHDELVFEVEENAVKRYAQIIKEEMESVANLTVPLIVDVKAGISWEEMVVLS